MKGNSVIVRALHQVAAVAPAIGGVATVYGVHHAFNSLQMSSPSQTVAGGIAHALAATVVLLVGVLLAAVLYSFVGGGGNDNGAA